MLTEVARLCGPITHYHIEDNGDMSRCENGHKVVIERGAEKVSTFEALRQFVGL